MIQMLRASSWQLSKMIEMDGGADENEVKDNDFQIIYHRNTECKE